MFMMTGKYLPCAAAAVTFFAAGAAVFYSDHRNSPEMPEEPAVSGTVFAEEIQAQLPLIGSRAPEAALPEQGYVLKLDGDTLSIYKEGEQEAEATYELPAGWLPDYDRILLEYGMKVGSEDELRELIEDYLS